MTDTLASAAVEAYRLSPQQKRVWTSESAGVPLRAQCVLQIIGDLRTDDLEHALAQLVGRHEILRTVFPRRSGMTMPTQAIAGAIPTLRRTGQPESIDRLLEEEQHRIFDFDLGPLLHAVVASQKPTEHLLVLTLPTICADSWSLRVIFRELADYNTRGNLEYEDPIQYVQFSEWQNEILATDDEHRQAGHAYWRKALSDLPAPPELPFELPDSDSISTPHNEALEVTADELCAELQASLREFCSKNEITTAAALAAVWNATLALWTGGDNLALRYVLDGRKFSELYGGVGLYASQVPIKIACESEASFGQLARRINEALQDAAHFQEFVPGDSADGSGIAFSFGDEAVDTANDANFKLIRSYCRIEPFKLKLTCIQRPTGLWIALEYDARRFRSEDVKRLADSFRVLLQSALAEPESPIGSLGFIPPYEHEWLVNELNRTERDFDECAAIHTLFESAAERNPEGHVLVCGNERLTYRELNTRANRLAHHLVERGIAADSVVGLCMDRSPNLIVGLLGIVKAGGAYLPLDPALPPQRLSDMIVDSGARLVVTHSPYASLFDSALDQVLLDQDASEIGNQSAENPTIDVCGNNLIYVIYTSGSTGKSKGVAIEHRNLVNYVQGASERLQLPAAGSYATVSTISADLGNTMLFPALCLGGCLHVVSADDSTDPTLWRAYLAEHQIDCLKIVPSHLSALLGDSEDIAELLPRSVLVLGGEASNWDLIRRIRNASPALRIINHYGPTETTVGVLTYGIIESTREDSATVPLGRPLPNSKVFILNDHHNPVPIGVVGEVYLGGSGVGRGYLNQPGLTADRFVHCPTHLLDFRLSGYDGAIQNPKSKIQNRLYKTGDRARYLPDGNIEFLGRVDHQVKIRGFRIELGEIESVLLKHPSVRDAVVVARDDGDRGQSLAGYVVASDGSLDVADVRAHLQKTLPAYMVPPALVLLPRLPLTANGKIDRQALPDPQSVEESSDRARTAFEELLAGIWEDLLGIEHVGIRQSFFELGGHSLLAMQLVSRIRETFKVELPLRALFETATIEGLAGLIQEMQRSGEGLLLPPMGSVSQQADIPLSFSQQRLWFINELQPNTHMYNVPRALRICGRLDRCALQHTLQLIVSRHAILRTTYRSIGGAAVQVVAPKTEFDLPIVDLSDFPHKEALEQARRLAREEAVLPFDLSHDPLLRGTLLTLADDDHIILLTTHHIASDGWSNGILTRELSAFYNAGGRNTLPDLPMQYADYAAWQRGWLNDEVLERQIEYWRQKLSGAPPVLALPTDRSRDDAAGYDGALEHFTVAADMTACLHKLGREERATQFMTLLAAFKVMLYRWTGESDLVIGTDLANRNMQQTERLIGFFLNHLVLRTELSGDASFREVVRRVRETCLGAYAHQDLPFDRLVEVLQPERRASHTPVFQVLFVVQDVPAGGIQLSGLECSEFAGDAPPSKFDLSLFLGELKGQLVGTWVYRTDLFDVSTIKLLSRQFVAVLEELLGNPERSIEDVELISATACVSA